MRKNLVREVFGRLTVISFAYTTFAGKDKQPKGCWNCKCVCGAKLVAQSGNLQNGHTQSCGCLQKERTSAGTTHHGQAALNKRTPTYNSWRAMTARCLNPKAVGYKNYGGAGIVVCKHWKTFEGFYASMGERPVGTTLGRFLDKGNYKPSNCKWMTSKEQGKEKHKKFINTGLPLGCPQGNDDTTEAVPLIGVASD
jgi:hypothetical protein